MKTYNIPLVFTPSSTLNQNLVSQALPLRNYVLYSVQAEFTATPNGAFTLQASADPEEYTIGSKGPTNWTTVCGSLITVTDSGNALWNVREIAYNWARLAYTDASGGTSTAAVTAVLNGKGV